MPPPTWREQASSYQRTLDVYQRAANLIIPLAASVNFGGRARVGGLGDETRTGLLACLVLPLSWMIPSWFTVVVPRWRL